jgi:hypothetical protein
MFVLAPDYYAFVAVVVVLHCIGVVVVAFVALQRAVLVL